MLRILLLIIGIALLLGSTFVVEDFNFLWTFWRSELSGYEYNLALTLLVSGAIMAAVGVLQIIKKDGSIALLDIFAFAASAAVFAAIFWYLAISNFGSAFNADSGPSRIGSNSAIVLRLALLASPIFFYAGYVIVRVRKAKRKVFLPVALLVASTVAFVGTFIRWFPT